MKTLITATAAIAAIACTVAVTPARAQALAINQKAPTVAQTELEIAAPPKAVWAALTDVARWPEMMPEISSAQLDGPLAPGSTIRWTPFGAKVESRIVAVEKERRLVWNGTDGAVHVWVLEPTPKGTLLRNSESIEDWKAAGPGKDSSASLASLLTAWNHRLGDYAMRQGR